MPATTPLPQDERSWWRRTLLVLVSPRAAFAALRDDSDEAAQARQEPVTAVVLVAGMAAVLMTSVTGRLFDDPEFDALVVVVWTIVAGAIHGIAGYFLLGGLVYLGGSFLGSLGSYRRARHLVGFAAVPLVLSLLVWPVRLALHGRDTFRTGGSDADAAGAAFDALELVLVGWSIVLLAVGLRAVHGWSRPRAAAALAIAVSPVALLVFLSELGDGLGGLF